MKKTITTLFCITLTGLVVTLSNCGSPQKQTQKQTQTQKQNTQTNPVPQKQVKGEKGEAGARGRRGSRGSSGSRGSDGEDGRLGLPGWCPDFDIWNWDEATDTHLNFQNDPPDNGPLHSVLGASGKGKADLRKYLRCHSDPDSIIKLTVNNTWLDAPSGSDSKNPSLVLGDPVMRLLDVSNTASDWTCSSGIWTVTKKFDGTNRDSNLIIGVGLPCP